MGHIMVKRESSHGTWVAHKSVCAIPIKLFIINNYETRAALLCPELFKTIIALSGVEILLQDHVLLCIDG